MKIISGDKKGTKLKTKKGLTTRPLQARVKKSLFSILGERLYGAVFLDLFAGNGGVGIEALSRNATFCYFVDKDEKCSEILRENLKNLNLWEKAKVFKLDFRRALSIFENDGILFDIIFIGPPYDSGLAIMAVEILSLSKIIKSETVLIFETRKKNPLPDEINNIIKYREERYGDTLLSFYKYKS